MSALDHMAAADHAVMAESLLDVAAKHLAAMQAGRVALNRMEQLSPAGFADENPDYQPLVNTVNAARADYDRAIAAAHVHAVLATIPRTYELTSELDEIQARPSTPIVGDRVVFLNPPSERDGRRYLGSDALGTVSAFRDGTGMFEGIPGADVIFDDIGLQWIGLEQLRVVLDA